jgi:superfamily I DNA/RNA helicase
VGLLEGVDYDDLDGGIDDQEVYKSLMRGEKPRVETFESFQAEADAIAEYLEKKNEDSDSLRDTCIIARTKSLLDNYSGALRTADLDTYPIRNDRAEDRSEPGVRLATMHRAKGLEFERVIIPGVSKGIVPLDRALSQAEDEATREQFLKRERSLLYVSATRAKREVVVTCHDEPSPWISVQ